MAVWTILSPHHLDRIRNLIALPIPLTLVAFAIYTVSIALISWDKISIGYSLQMAFYILFGFFLITGYLKQAIEARRIRVTFSIVSIVALIYLTGVIVSAWTGPIYPHQVLNIDKLLGADRAIGFSEGSNAAAAIVLSLLSVAAFVNKRSRPLFVGLVFIALLLTLSRSAAIGLGVAFGLLILLKGLNAFVNGRDISRYIVITWIAVLLAIASPTVFDSFLDIEDVPPLAATIQRLQLDESEMSADRAFFGRTRIWDRGLGTWAAGNPFQIIFGQGLRRSQTTSQGQIWNTAHNSYIAFLGDLGLVGFWLFVIPILWLIMSLGFKIATANHDALDVYTFLALTSLAVHNMTGLFFYSPVVLSLTLMIIVFYVSLRTFKAPSQTDTAPEPDAAFSGSHQPFPAPIRDQT